MMTARTARWVAVPVTIVVALAIAFAAWMFWITQSAKTSWLVPAAYTVSDGDATLTLYGWGGACDKPLSARVLARGKATVTVEVLRTVAAGSCTANAELHQVDVVLGQPLGGREVRDRTGVTIPVAASAAAVLAHPSEFGFGSG